MYRLAYRNFRGHESLLVTHTIVAGSSTGIRWYELRNPNGEPTVFQTGTFAPDASYRWMGSIAMDKAGDLGMGYSVSSSSIHPSIAYTGRTPIDPFGSMEPETIAVAGGGSLEPDTAVVPGGGSHPLGSKWSDNSVIRIDPSDDCTFWYGGQYLKTDGRNWSTHIGSFSFPKCHGY